VDVEELEPEGLDALEDAVEGCLVDVAAQHGVRARGAAARPANASMSVSLGRPRTVIS